MEEISLGTEPQEQEQISIDAGDTRGIPQDPVSARRKAFIAYQGTGAYSKKTLEQLYNSISMGMEPDERSTAALAIDQKSQQNADQYLQNVLSNRNAPITSVYAKALATRVGALTAPTDPETVFETYFAHDLHNNMYQDALSKPDNPVAQTQHEFSDAAETIKSTATETTAKILVLKDYYEQAQQALKNQGWVGWGVDLSKSLVPGYSDWIQRGNVPKAEFSIMRGVALENQMKALFRLPIGEFKKQLDVIFKDLVSRNPSQAVEFFHALDGLSSKDIFANTLFSGIDAVFALGAAKTLGKLGSKLNVVKDAVEASKSAAKAIARDPNPTPATLAEAVGDTAKSGTLKAAQDIKDEAKAIPEIINKQHVEALTTYLRTEVDAVNGAPGSLGREGANRISENIFNAKNGFMQALGEFSRVNRTPSIEEVTDAIKTKIKDMYPEVSNSIMDIRGPNKDLISGANWIDFHFGKTGTELFDSRDTAKAWIDLFGFKGARVEPQGIGFRVVHSRPISEVDDVIRDGLFATANSKVPQYGELFSWINFGRTPEETLSLAHRQNRKIAEFGVNRIAPIIAETGKPLTQLAKSTNFWDRIYKSGKFHDLVRTINVLKDTPDSITGELGTWFRNPSEMDQFYLTHFKRAPTPLEAEAYWAYKTNTELDAAFRDLSIYANKARVGAEEYNFSVMSGEDKLNSGYISGVRRHTLPGSDTIMVLGSDKSQIQILRGGRINTTLKNRLNQEIKEGKLKVIEIYDPESRPFRDVQGFDAVGDSRIRYVIAPNVENKPLNFIQLPRRGGGHVQYEYGHYLKQAKVAVDWVNGKNPLAYYEGDTTILAIGLPKIGRDIAGKLNKVRISLKNGKLDEAIEHARTLPFDWEDLRKWFGVNKDGTRSKQSGKLSLDETIKLVRNGERTVDKDMELARRYSGHIVSPSGELVKSEFIDATRRSSLARTQQVEFTQARDADNLLTAFDVGTKNNPIYNIGPAKYVDPIHTMNRALNRIINSTFMDDYKQFAVEHWIQRAVEAGVIKDGMLSEIRSAPFWYFNHENIFKSGADKAIINSLENERYRIKQLVGAPSALSANIYSLNLKAVDWLYTKLGPKGVLIDPVAQLPKLQDPLRFFRSVAFHEKIGLFNLPTLWAQMQTFITIAGIEGPSKAIPGALGSLFHRYSRINASESIINHMDNIAVKLGGFKPGQWKEAYNELKATGFDRVGSEYADMGDLYPKTIKTRFGTFLDAGTSFFRWGEEQMRWAAWYTAYKKFRELNPTKVFTKEDRAWVLDRADLLNGNMSRASNSLMNHGALAVPTQFYTYQLRLAELFTGHRLTSMEKLRLFTAHMGMYGLPIATGLSGIPVADVIRRTALENNYVVGDNYITSLVMEGIPSVITALVNGEGDIRKGRFMNYGSRWGTEGYSPLKNLFSDEDMWKVIVGASGSSVGEMLKSSSGLYQAMISGITGEQFKLTYADVLDIGKEISSINNGYRLYAALNTGRWLSKNENISETGIGPLEASYMSVFGLQPQEVVDARLKQQSMKNAKNVAEDAIKLFVKNMHRAMQADVDNNPEQAQKFYTNAFGYLHLYVPEDNWPKAFSKAFAEQDSLVARVNWDYYTKNIKDKDKRDKFEQLHRWLQGRNR